MSVFLLTTLYKTPAGGTINVNISRYMFLFYFVLAKFSPLNLNMKLKR